MEKLDLRTHSSLAKSTGTVLSVGGALIVTLYKGYPIMGQPSIIESVIELELKATNWVIGGVLLSAASLIFALLYILQAVLVVAVGSVVHTWVCLKKGPVFAASFKPIGVVIAVVLGVSFLRDTLYIGSVIGAAILAIGFYGVIWGKAQGEKFVNETSDSSSSNKAPLLKNKSMQV